MELERPRASASVAPAPPARPSPLPAPAPTLLSPGALGLSRVAPASTITVPQPRSQSPIVISDDEELTVSYSPITISEDDEEESVPVRRLPIAPIRPLAPVPPTAPLASVIPPATVIQPASLIPPAPVAPTVPVSATPQVDNGQVGGAKTQKRIEFDETDCRRVFRKALLCKTFTPQDEYADLNTMLYSFAK